MAAPHFYLKDKHSTAETLISLYYRSGSRRFVYSTNERVKPTLWSFKKERVLARHPNAKSINSKLERILQAFHEQYEKLQAQNGYVKWSDLKQELDISIGKVKANDNLYQFFDAFIEQKRASKQFGERSIGVYTSARTLLKEFASSKKMQEIDFSDVSYELWQEMEEYLLEKNYSSNYIRKILSKIKSVLRDALKKGIKLNVDISALDISTKSEETTAIYLTKEEINKLYQIDYSNDGKLEKARDLFIAGAVTGLRYSDFVKISTENIRIIDGLEFLDMLSKKTKKQVIIPVHPLLKELLIKYDGKLPTLSQQKMNDYLKIIGEQCGFMNDNVNKVKTIGGKTTSNLVPKYQLFTTHTARRSFATNAYLDGWDLLSIMMITGHSSEKQLLTYIRVSEEENALRIAKARIKHDNEQLAQAIESLKWLEINAVGLGLDALNVRTLLKRLSHPNIMY